MIENIHIKVVRSTNARSMSEVNRHGKTICTSYICKMLLHDVSRQGQCEQIIVQSDVLLYIDNVYRHEIYM